jgi:hypothetical protein
MKPCKHLDYDIKSYPSCKLITIRKPAFNIEVKYWERNVSEAELKEFPDTAIKVQFCKERGRIKGIFQCYNENELSCYEVE